MDRLTNVHCGRCRQPIISGEGFVRFKIPGKEIYQLFHYRVRVGDCWEGHLSAPGETYERHK